MQTCAYRPLHASALNTAGTERYRRISVCWAYPATPAGRTQRHLWVSDWWCTRRGKRTCLVHDTGSASRCQVSEKENVECILPGCILLNVRCSSHCTALITARTVVCLAGEERHEHVCSRARGRRSTQRGKGRRIPCTGTSQLHVLRNCRLPAHKPCRDSSSRSARAGITSIMLCAVLL